MVCFSETPELLASAEELGFLADVLGFFAEVLGFFAEVLGFLAEVLGFLAAELLSRQSSSLPSTEHEHHSDDGNRIVDENYVVQTVNMQLQSVLGVQRISQNSRVKMY